MHHKKIGRPKMKIELNFNDPFKKFEEIERLSKLDGMKEVLVSFATAIHDLFSENEDTEMIEEISDINPYTKVLNIHVTSVSIRHQERIILGDTWKPYTRVFCNIVSCASIKQ